MARFAHLINPVKIDATSDLYFAQPITFESMRIAQEMAKKKVSVELLTTQYEEDREIIPEFFTKTPDLSTSALKFGEFKLRRKLPLLREILYNLHENTNADYLIYTNVDIALMPHFYLTINEIINEGFDAFTINRRTIPNSFSHISELPLMYATIGKKHPGHDCFIFKRSLFNKFIFCNACLGINHVGKMLLLNMLTKAQKFKVFKDLHLTFHIGDDLKWRNPEYNDYTLFNAREIMDMANNLDKVNLTEDHKILFDKVVRHVFSDLAPELPMPPKVKRGALRKMIKNWTENLISK